MGNKLKVGKKRQTGRCEVCIHRKVLGVDDFVQCKHPMVLDIQNRFPERKPTLTKAIALNLMGKALSLKIDPLAYRNPFFSWPSSYHPACVVSCAGFNEDSGPQWF